MEIWKTYKNIEVSSYGRVKTVSKGVHNGFNKKDGYLGVTVNNRSKLVHRIVAELFIGKPTDEKKTDVGHKDGNIKNNNYSNLEWRTRKETLSIAHENGSKIWVPENTSKTFDEIFSKPITRRGASQWCKRNGYNIKDLKEEFAFTNAHGASCYRYSL